MNWQKEPSNLTKTDWFWICSCVFTDSRSGFKVTHWLGTVEFNQCRSYMVLHRLTWSYMALHGLSWPYLVLHGLTWSYMVDITGRSPWLWGFEVWTNQVVGCIPICCLLHNHHHYQYQSQSPRSWPLTVQQRTRSRSGFEVDQTSGRGFALVCSELQTAIFGANYVNLATAHRPKKPWIWNWPSGFTI